MAPADNVLRPLASPLGGELAELVRESEGEGFRFLARLVDEHERGVATFAGAGEALLGAYDGEALVAVGGVMRDPYAEDAGLGRLRHLYVARSHRRRGIGERIVRALEEHARGTFAVLVLRTDTEAAARFYEALGYEALPPGGTATHRRRLG